jgi:hypothetical protein
VIDLEATDVSAKAAEPESVPVAETPEPVPVTDPPAAETAQRAAPEAGPEPKPEPEPNAEPKPEAEPERRRALGWLPEELTWAQAGAGIAGAAGALLVFVLLWLAGAFTGGGHLQTADVSPRLASIEQQLQALASRPVPQSADPKAVDALASRLLKLEAAQAAPRAPVNDPVVLGRLGAAENAMKSLADHAAALSRRADAADAALREANSRIEKLSAALNEVQTAVRSAAVGSDRASRLALAASALRDAVDQGAPFAAELAVVKPLAPDAEAVAALAPFAESGVPSEAALGKELAAIVRPLLRAAPAAASGGSFIDRLQANAEKLVRIRPVDEEPKGDDNNAMLMRIEQRASQGNVAGALSEIARLPAAARAPMQSWIARAQARRKAVEASRRLAADAVAALKATP